MLYTIAVVLLLLWLLGVVSSYTISGFIHILLVVAVVMVLVRLIRGPPGPLRAPTMPFDRWHTRLLAEPISL